MTELRRAAEAKKGLRIAQRLAILAEGKAERVTWSSSKEPTWRSLSEVVGRVLSSLPAQTQAEMVPSREGRLK